ncbi:unnamed protein product, partial [Prorocentrum cordatum]
MRDGCLTSLTEQSPSRIARFLERDLQEAHLVRSVNQLLAGKASEGRRLFATKWIWAKGGVKIHHSSKMPDDLNQLFRLVFTDACPTAARLHSWGYRMEPLCQYCRQRGTVWHRVRCCPHFADQRAEMLEPEGIEAALEAGPESLFYNKFWWAARPIAKAVPFKEECPQYMDDECNNCALFVFPGCNRHIRPIPVRHAVSKVKAHRSEDAAESEAARAEPAAESAGSEAHGLPERQVDEADTMMRQTMGQLLKEMQQDLGDMLGPGEASCEATTAEADPRGQPRSGSVEPGGPHGAAAEAELAQEGTPMGKLLQEMQHSFGDDAPVPGLGARALRPVPPAFADAAADEPQGAPAAQ